MTDDRYPRASEIDKSFQKHLANTNLSLVDLFEFISQLKEDDLNGHLAAYRMIYENHALLEKLSKLISKLKQDLSYQVIPDIMDKLKITSVRYDGRNYIKSVRLFASIPENKQKEGYAWLKEAGLGSIIKETANANTLSSVIGDYIEETGITPPDDVMTLHRQPYTQVRK